MFCPKGCSLDAGLYPRSFASVGDAGGGWVAFASSGRVTAIWTVVVVPTKTGSVPRGPSATPAGWAAPAGSGAAVSYSV